jgi:hypothetical protein
MPIVKSKSFVLFSSCKKTYSQCSKVHICTLMWPLGWHFQLLPFLILFS